MSLQSDWFDPRPDLGARCRTALRWPLAALFGLVGALRRALYRSRLLHAERLPVPVVVIGNLIVGGAGKTPLTLHLVDALRARGFHPGIVSRGYGGAGEVRVVLPDSSPHAVGDEPVLLARRSGVPVAVGRRRGQAGRLLLRQHPEVDVLICDDGLQHYALARDLEIAVVDRRRFGNGWLLPAGPLREPLSRLHGVDAVVAHDTDAVSLAALAPGGQVFQMNLHGVQFSSVGAAARVVSADALRGRRLYAIAGIGEPQRFFDTLRGLGLDAVERAFPDHHRYGPADLAFAADGVLLMTEKDAVKCAGLTAGEAWFLPVSANVSPNLADWVVEKLNGRKVA